MRRNRGGWADIRSSLPPERAFAEPVLGSWAGGMVLQRRAAYVRALSSATTVSAMRDKRLDVSVSFDSRRGYFTTGSELPQSVTALSLGGLRRRIEVALLPDEPARIGDIVRIASAAGHSKLTGCDSNNRTPNAAGISKLRTTILDRLPPDPNREVMAARWHGRSTFNRSRHPDLSRVTPGTRQIVQSGERRPECLLHAPSAEERDRRSSHD
jgi:hypothetical protein